MADKTITVNSLVQMGIVPQDVAGDLLNAPPRVNEWLEELETKFKTNAFAPAKPVAEGASPKVPTAEEADVAEGLALLKAKREADVKAKGLMVNALKANAKCKFTVEELEKMTADTLKTLSDSIGTPVANHGPAAGGGGAPAAPKANSVVFTGAPAMPSHAEGMALLNGK